MTVEAYEIATALTDGVVTDFPFTFSVSSAADVRVTLEVVATGVQVPVAAEDFTVTLGEVGGTVTYLEDGEPVPTGTRVIMWRETAISQTYSVNSQTKYNPELVATLWDKAFRGLQEEREKSSRALRMPLLSEDSGEVVLPEDRSGSPVVVFTAEGGFGPGPNTDMITSAQQILADFGDLETALGDIADSVSEVTTASAEAATKAGEAATSATTALTAKEDAETAQGLAEDARDTALLHATDAETYAAAAASVAVFEDTIALGRAAVADGETFGVKAGGSDGLLYATIYRRDSSSTQTFIVDLAPASVSAALPQVTRAAASRTRTGFAAGEVRLTAQSPGNLNDFTGVTAAVVGDTLDLTCVTPNSGSIMWNTGNYRGAVQTRIRITETVDVGDVETGEFGPLVVVGSVADSTMRIFHYASDGDLHVLGYNSTILTSKANPAMSFAKGEAATLDVQINEDGTGYMLATSPAGLQAKFPFTGAPVGAIWPGLRRGHSAVLSGWRVDLGADAVPTLSEDRALGGLQKPIQSRDVSGPFAATTDAISSTQLVTIADGVVSAAITNSAAIFYETTPQVITDQGAWEVVSSASYGDMNGCGPIVGVGAGAARRWYAYLGNGFLGVFLNANSVESGGATATAFAVDTVATLRLLRRRDGTGILEATAPDGSTASLALTGIPTGAVSMGFRKPGTGSGTGETAVSRFVVQPVPETATELEARVTTLEAPRALVARGHRVLPTPPALAGRTPAGWTCTGADVFDYGVNTGLILSGDDGRLVEGDASPYARRVHLVMPGFGAVVKSLSLGTTSLSSVQGTAIDRGFAPGTFWTAHGTGDNYIRNWEADFGTLDGTAVAAVERAANAMGWSADLSLTSTANGLAYDSDHGAALWASPISGAWAVQIDIATKAVLQTITLASSTPDQLQYLPAAKTPDGQARLIYTTGTNGSPIDVRVYNLVTGVDALWETLPGVEAGEQFFYDPVSNIGWAQSDGAYHNSANPPENAVWWFAMPPLPGL